MTIVFAFIAVVSCSSQKQLFLLAQNVISKYTSTVSTLVVIWCIIQFRKGKNCWRFLAETTEKRYILKKYMQKTLKMEILWTFRFPKD